MGQHYKLSSVAAAIMISNKCPIINQLINYDICQVTLKAAHCIYKLVTLHWFLLTLPNMDKMNYHVLMVKSLVQHFVVACRFHQLFFISNSFFCVLSKKMATLFDDSERKKFVLVLPKKDNHN